MSYKPVKSRPDPHSVPPVIALPTMANVSFSERLIFAFCAMLELKEMSVGSGGMRQISQGKRKHAPLVSLIELTEKGLTLEVRAAFDRGCAVVHRYSIVLCSEEAADIPAAESYLRGRVRWFNGVTKERTIAGLYGMSLLASGVRLETSRGKEVAADTVWYMLSGVDLPVDGWFCLQDILEGLDTPPVQELVRRLILFGALERRTFGETAYWRASSGAYPKEIASAEAFRVAIAILCSSYEAEKVGDISPNGVTSAIDHLISVGFLCPTARPGQWRILPGVWVCYAYLSYAPVEREFITVNKECAVANPYLRIASFSPALRVSLSGYYAEADRLAAEASAALVAAASLREQANALLSRATGWEGRAKCCRADLDLLDPRESM